MNLVKVNENIEGRKVFYVDVGDMSSKEAEKFLNKIILRRKKCLTKKCNTV